ncbi:hypothetical protein IC229_30160 [Spirosoma sp. BT702]|uniref:Uncharacterized protein n=1 Tax=Spirosoma profusum TaxID=2771354 RepID=A0A927GA48_9BACT|nr:DUF6577 family protein [Spirosoma profusum]MBD2704934.1 hypothetical protein [Spirosoma profusum]
MPELVLIRSVCASNEFAYLFKERIGVSIMHQKYTQLLANNGLFANNWVYFWCMIETPFISHFSYGRAISKQELIQFLMGKYPQAKPSTLNWHIHDLVQKGILYRQGRGSYRLNKDSVSQSLTPNRRQFRPSIPDQLKKWDRKLRKSFPYLTLCIWSTQSIQAFSSYQSFTTYWFIEVERTALDTVLEIVLLAKLSLPIVKATDLNLTERYRTDTQTVVIIKQLISEAPLQQVDGIFTVTLEKMLVDLLADENVFEQYQEELPNIVQEATREYAINLDKLRRYARRRNKLTSINKLFAQVDL